MLKKDHIDHDPAIQIYVGLFIVERYISNKKDETDPEQWVRDRFQLQLYYGNRCFNKGVCAKKG